ncbi:LIMR family protein [Acrasis kona]|uniref:LIMR family protein n=1 Tax=Acrasis kona TaxID=1008807 RepID=A0AAW2Z047_9EUKA
MNVFLIVLLVVIPVLFIFFSFLFVVFFSSPVDRFQAVLPKIIVILGMALAGCAVLFLPFDVWNNSQGGGLTNATPIIWQIVFAVIAAFIVIIVPFSMLYFEAYDSDKPPVKNVLCQTLCASIGTVIIFLIVGAASHYKLSMSTARLAIQNAGTLLTRMGIVVYITAFLCFFGWLVFVICGGCGMSAIPISLILACIKKPKRIKMDEFVMQQKKFAVRANNLIEAGKKVEDLRRQPGGRTNLKTVRLYQDFKRAVYQCEEEYLIVKTQFEKGGGSIFLYGGALILGILAIIVTILWIVHIIVFMLTPVPLWGGLNYLFYYLDLGFPLFGLIAYSIFAFYLLMAIIAGNITIASRLPFISLYPIKFKDTLTSSFLYNTGLLLFGSIAVIQFTANAFSRYARFTSLNGFFNVYVSNMIYIRYYFMYVHYAFFGFIFIGFVLSMIFAFIPNKTKEQKMIEQIMAS